MADLQAINASNITTIGVGIIIALVVGGFLLGLIITAIIGRVIIVVAVVVLGAFVWQQRGHVKDEFDRRVCTTHPTFFGIHVDPPNSLAQTCVGRQ